MIIALTGLLYNISLFVIFMLVNLRDNAHQGLHSNRTTIPEQNARYLQDASSSRKVSEAYPCMSS